MILIFEGPDKSGKTTLREAVRKARMHQDVTLDRFFGSMIVYGKVYARNTDRDESLFYLKEHMFEDSFHPLLIHCTAPENILKTRMRKLKHEKIPDGILDRTLYHYRSYFLNTRYRNKVEIDTSVMTVNEAVNKIIKKIKEVEKTQII